MSQGCFKSLRTSPGVNTALFNLSQSSCIGKHVLSSLTIPVPFINHSTLCHYYLACLDKLKCVLGAMCFYRMDVLLYCGLKCKCLLPFLKKILLYRPSLHSSILPVLSVPFLFFLYSVITVLLRNGLKSGVRLFSVVTSPCILH